jgi:LysM repeat protein
MEVYRVTQFDTLAAIAKRYDLTANIIMSVNNMATAEISCGDRLIIPKGSTVYTVKPLETLSSIARKFSTTAERLKEINYIDNVFIGQTILIE